MSRRSLARQAAMQVLYEDEFNPERKRELDQAYVLEQVEQDLTLEAFAWLLIDGTRGRKAEIDPDIAIAAENWSVYRMTAVDRTLLRMACFECRYSETPIAVGIDEAIRLAKRFGSKDSPAFINGVLDRILGGRMKSLTSTERNDGTPHGSQTDMASTAGPDESGRGSGLRRFMKMPPKEA